MDFPSRIVLRLGLRSWPDDPAVLIPVLHGWIQRSALPGATLIDVADYLHVPGGPGVLLVADEANYAFSPTHFSYQRKRPLAGDARTKVETAIRAAALAADCIEKETSLRLDRRPIRLESNDRLLAPNDEATWRAWSKALAPWKVEPVSNDPRERFAVLLRDGPVL